MAFDWLDRRSTAQLKIIMERGTERGYFPNPSKSLLIAYNPKDKEAVRWEFERSGQNLNYVGRRQNMGSCLGPRDKLEAWLLPIVKAWSHSVRTLAKVAK